MSVFSLLQLWNYDLYKAMWSGAAGIQPHKVVSRPLNCHHTNSMSLNLFVVLLFALLPGSCGSTICTRPCGQVQQASSPSRSFPAHQASTGAGTTTQKTQAAPPPPPPLRPQMRLPEGVGLRHCGSPSVGGCRASKSRRGCCRRSGTLAPGARSLSSRRVASNRGETAIQRSRGHRQSYPRPCVC